MGALPTLPATAGVSDVNAALDEVGAVIVDGLVDAATLDRLRRDLAPWVGSTPAGSRSGDAEWEKFHGRNTVRFNGIAAKTSTFTEICLDDTILGVADRRLIPDGGATQISDTQLIAIGPGEPAQYLHRDQTGWPWFNQYLPDGPEIVVIAMLAVTDFTADNGATRVVPGSHLLADSDDLFDPAGSIPAEMSAGSVLLFSGKTIHGGGANHTTDQWRHALHVSYLLGWLRPEEAHVLSVPTAVGASLPRRAQELLGFAEYDPAPHGGGRLWLVDFEDPARSFTPAATAHRLDHLHPQPIGARSGEKDILMTTDTNPTSHSGDTGRLPQLAGRTFISEAGFETDLLFNHGIDLPHFATFGLLESADHRETFRTYFQAVIDLARRDDTGVVIETATWRASSDWGALLGYDADALDRANHDAVEFFIELRDANPDVPVVISGNMGPRGDGYTIADTMSAQEAAAYHRPQVRSLAHAGADLVSAFTLTYADEATGIVRAAVGEGIPVVISFTVETDGRLPSGQTLAAAIEQVDGATDGAAAYFMVNCAHPTHFAHVLDSPGPWDRLRGIRANASTMSHHELDNATELDRGDEALLVDGYLAIAERLPDLAVTGGCCGTDLAHLDRISAAFAARSHAETAAS